MPKKKLTWPLYHITQNLTTNQKNKAAKWTKYVKQTEKLLHCIQHRRRWTKKSYAFNFCWRRSKWYYWRTTVWTNHTRKKTKRTSISSSWLCKTTSTQKTTLSITDLYSEKKPKKQTIPNIEDFHRELKEAAMCRFTDRNAEIKSQLITGCLSEKVRQKGLMNPNMLLGDLISYAKMTETISEQMEQMRLEDANSTTKPTTSVNAVANKVTHEQQWPRKRPQQNRVQKLQWEIPTWTGTDILPCIPEPVCLLPEMGTLHLCLFQKTKWRGQTAKNKSPPTPTSSNQSMTGKLHWGPSTRLKQWQWHGICIPYR